MQNVTISEEDAASKKASLHPAGGVAVKTWHFHLFASTTAAVIFLNQDPPQVAGEVSAIALNNGTIGVFYFV